MANKNSSKSVSSNKSTTADSKPTDQAAPVINASSMTLEQLREMVAVRTQQEIASAQGRVEALRAELTAAQALLTSLTPASGEGAKRVNRKRGRKPGKGAENGSNGTPRVRNEQPLYQVLHSMFKGAGSFTPKDAVDKLEKSDFKTNAKNKYILAYTALKGHEDLFKKIDRGVFEAI